MLDLEDRPHNYDTYYVVLSKQNKFSIKMQNNKTIVFHILLIFFWVSGFRFHEGGGSPQLYCHDCSGTTQGTQIMCIPLFKI